LLDMNSFLVPRIQGCVWEEKCRHIAQTLTIWLCHWSCGRKATSIQTHLQFVTRQTCSASWIHRWKPQGIITRRVQYQEPWTNEDVIRKFKFLLHRKPNITYLFWKFKFSHVSGENDFCV
jgi:hypothetical protein